MAIDNKYGIVLTELGNEVFGAPGIPFNQSGDEPCFIIRAQDAASLEAIRAYGNAAADVGASDELLAAINHVVNLFAAWQNEHPDRVKVPD